jgi:ribosomal protein L16
MSEARVRSNQLESARKVIARSLGKTGKTWIRVFPDMPFTQKPAEVKMGKGKGDPVGYQVQVWPGRIMFEIDGIDEATAREALRKAGTKLPVKTKLSAEKINCIMNEFKNKTEKDLKKLLPRKRKALQTFRFSISGSKTRNVKEGKRFRKQLLKF